MLPVALRSLTSGFDELRVDFQPSEGDKVTSKASNCVLCKEEGCGCGPNLKRFPSTSEIRLDVMVVKRFERSRLVQIG